MAVTLAQLRTALKTTIEAATSGVHVYAKVPAAVDPKCVVILPRSAEAQTMGRGVTLYTLDAVCVAATADSEHGQDVLDTMLESEGAQILAAVETDKTLGLTGVQAHVSGWDDYGTTDWGDTAYYTATIPVVIVVTKA